MHSTGKQKLQCIVSYSVFKVKKRVIIQDLNIRKYSTPGGWGGLR